MTVLKVLLILTIMETIRAKPIDNLLLLNHHTGPSHLLVVLDLAERLQNDSENVYDVRFPMLKSIRDFKSRQNFKLRNFELALKRTDELQKYLDSFVIESPKDILVLLKMIGNGLESLLIPCKLTDNIFNFSDKKNLALIDIYSSACYTVIARKHGAKIAYVAPGTEPSTVSSFSGAPLPAYAISGFKGNPTQDFSIRLMDFFVHGLFKYYFLQIPVAKWLYNVDDRNYENLKESVVIVNAHRFLAFPLPRTHLIVEMGNLAEKPIKSFDSVSLFISSHINK